LPPPTDGAAVRGQRAVGRELRHDASGNLVGGERLEVRTVERLAQCVPAAGHFEPRAGELALAKERARQAHGFEGGRTLRSENHDALSATMVALSAPRRMRARLECAKTRA